MLRNCRSSPASTVERNEVATPRSDKSDCRNNYSQRSGNRMQFSYVCTNPPSRLVLFPGQGSQELSPSYVATLTPPVTLLIPDGSWRQAATDEFQVPGGGMADHLALMGDPEKGPALGGELDDPVTKAVAEVRIHGRQHLINEQHVKG